MTQDKLRRIITACVVAATMLLVFLLSILIYQWIHGAVLERRKEELEKEISELEEQLKLGEEDAAYYESIFGKEWLAFQYGFIDPAEGN